MEYFHFIFIAFFLQLLIPDGANAYKILLTAPTVSLSHIISNARVADALAADGHDVTMLEIGYVVPVGQINASKLARIWRIPGKFLEFKLPGSGNQSIDFSELFVRDAFKGNQHSLWYTIVRHYFFFGLMQSIDNACEAFLNTQREQLELLKAENFDLLISEQYDLCDAGLAHVLNIPVYAMLHSCPLSEQIASVLGLPNPASWVPTLESDSSDKMTLYGRFENLMRYLIKSLTNGSNGFRRITAIFRKHYGENFPDVLDVIKNAAYIFVNVDEFVEFPRPLFHHIVYIGGLGLREKMDDKKAHDLGEPFNTEMSKGQNGVILFSLGSIVRSTHLPEDFLRNLFKAFSQLPEYHVIVKIEKNDNFSMEIAQQITNVFLADWVPQVALLNHPRLKLFITHAGYNSLMEAAWAGVPLITMPFFIDQHRNARVAERNAWALIFNKISLLSGSDEFVAAIQHVLSEQNFTKNAKRIRNLIRTKPFSPEERLQKSIRFLEENGGRLPELLPESRNMSTIALYNLDLIFLALLGMVALLSSFYFACKLLCRFLCGIMKKRKRKSE